MSAVRLTVEVGFLLVLWAIVLAFGGTDPIALPVIQAVVFVLAVVALWGLGRQGNFSQAPLLLAFLPLAYVGLQWLLLGESRPTIATHALQLFSYTAVFVIAYLLSQERNSVRRLLFGLLALGLFEVLYGLAQYLLDWPYIFTYHNVFYTGRATGTYINPNHFAGLVEMILPLSMGLALYGLESVRHAAGVGLREIGLDSEKTPRAVFYLFLSVFLLIGVVFSGSRMAIFSALGAGAAVVLFWASTSWSAKKAIPALLVFLLGVLSLGVWLGLEPVIVRYEGVERDYLARLALWKDAVSLIQERPLLGSGLGTFDQVYTQQQTTLLTRYVEHAHNDYLQFAVELGLLGSLLLFGLFVLALVKMISSFRHSRHGRSRYLLLGCAGGVLAILLHSLADFNLQIPANATVFAALLGLGCGLRNMVEQRHQHGGEQLDEEG